MTTSRRCCGALLPFPTSLGLTERIVYAGRADPRRAVIDWFSHSLMALRADVVRESPHVLRFQVPALLSLAPHHPLGGIHEGFLEVVESHDAITVDVTLTVTRAPAFVGAAAAAASAIALLPLMAGGLGLAAVLVTWPYVTARRNFGAYLRGASAALQATPDAHPG